MFVASHPSQQTWSYAGMLVLSLALGIAIAAGFDAWSESEEDTTPAELLADGAPVLVIAAAMTVFGRVTGLRLLEKDASPARKAPDRVK